MTGTIERTSKPLMCPVCVGEYFTEYSNDDHELGIYCDCCGHVLKFLGSSGIIFDCYGETIEL